MRLELAVLASLFVPGAALASYSAPLTRVHIDRDRTTHTPSVFYAGDRKIGNTFSTDLDAFGAQYLGQLEWANGFGLQLGAGLAYADIDLGLGLMDGRPRTSITGTGYLAGGQVRAYYMLWAGNFGLSSGERPNAITAFVNMRVVYYSASGEVASGSAAMFDEVESSFISLSAGTGLMAELAIAPWFSICPYAWFSPGIHQRSRYAIARGDPVEERAQLSLKQPMRAGIDAWFYPWGDTSEGHFALSAIASLVDTQDRGSRELSFVIGYTF